MALIKCPECGREKVSDQAKACPECGFPLKSKSPADTLRASFSQGPVMKAEKEPEPNSWLPTPSPVDSRKKQSVSASLHGPEVNVTGPNGWTDIHKGFISFENDTLYLNRGKSEEYRIASKSEIIAIKRVNLYTGQVFVGINQSFTIKRNTNTNHKTVRGELAAFLNTTLPLLQTTEEPTSQLSANDNDEQNTSTSKPVLGPMAKVTGLSGLSDAPTGLISFDNNTFYLNRGKSDEYRVVSKNEIASIMTPFPNDCEIMTRKNREFTIKSATYSFHTDKDFSKFIGEAWSLLTGEKYNTPIGCSVALLIAIVICCAVVVGVYYIESDIKNNEASKPVKSPKSRIASTSQAVVYPKGPKPLQSSWNGAVPCIVNYIKERLHDDDSYEGVSWSEIADKGDHWAVSHTYRAKNALGAKVIQKQLFRFQNPDGPVYCKILSVQGYQ